MNKEVTIIPHNDTIPLVIESIQKSNNSIIENNIKPLQELIENNYKELNDTVYYYYYLFRWVIM